jgi:hypothetical protein
MRKKPKSKSVQADSKKWSEKSRRSVSFHFVKEYHDITYKCRCCKESAVFSAVDQLYTYEVRKASSDQRRVLCEKCWRKLLVIDSDIASCRQQWASMKRKLRLDEVFLSTWLQLLISRQGYVPYRVDIATRSMLRKLLNQLPAAGATIAQGVTKKS